MSDEDASTRPLKAEFPGMVEVLRHNLEGTLHRNAPEVGLVVADTWELTRQLGMGGFGLVFEAWHLDLERWYAIKFLDPRHASEEVRSRFLTEAQIMAEIESEHLVRVFNYGELPDGTPYFVMDLVKGQTLRQHLQKPLSILRALEIGEEILSGLSTVHERHIIHGDIKPENIVIGDDDHKIRLLDFGLARTMALVDGDQGGTPPYMAPEILLDHASPGFRSDVFAVGVVLYEMLTGRLPRGHGKMTLEKIRRSWKKKPDPDPPRMHNKEVPKAIDKFVLRSLSRELTARPESAKAMLSELRQIRRQISSKTMLEEGLPTVFKRGKESIKKNKLWVSSAVVLGMAVGLVVGWAVNCSCGKPTPWDLDSTGLRNSEVANSDKSKFANDPVAFDVEYAGCTEIWLDKEVRCIFDPRTPLRLWVIHPDPTKVMVSIDGQPWPTEPYRIGGMIGFGLEVEPPQDAETLKVESSSGSTWSLPMQATAEDIRPPDGVTTNQNVDAEFTEVFRKISAGDPREAQRILTEMETKASRYPEGRAAHASFQGLVYWGQGRFHEAATSLRQAVLFAIRLSDPLLKQEALPLYAVILAELGYDAAASGWGEEALAFLRAEPELFSCAHRAQLLSTVGYIQVLLARQHKKPSMDPVPLLEEALDLVGPDGVCPQPDSVPAVLLSLANVRLERDDPRAALSTLAYVDYDDVPTSDQRFRLRDAEFRALLAANVDHSELETALERLREAVGEAGLAEGRWRLSLREGDLLAQQGQPEKAIEAYRHAEEEAQRLAELAAVGVGRDTSVTLHEQSTERLVTALVEQGRAAEALCVTREARARRIQAVARTTTVESTSALDEAIDRYEATRRKVDEWKSRGRILPRKESRALSLAVVESEEHLSEVANEILLARSTWRPSCEDLVPRGRGEVLLGLYPVTNGWFVFVEDDDGTVVRKLLPKSVLDTPEIAVELLGPLSKHLERAKKVRVLASGVAQDVDVHLLEFGGAPLVAHVPVVYGAELPAPKVQKQGTADPPVALLVADPTETLPMARTEVLTAAAKLMLHGGWKLKAPLPTESDRQRIRDWLETASFFYFAGHGEHDMGQTQGRSLPPYAGGTQAWPARLKLTPPTMLEIQDILMLDSAPRSVALIGCETGVTGGGVGGMSLALAFLVAGADEVVATPIEVSNEVAAATGLRLLDGIGKEELDLAEGLRQAQVEALAQGEPVGRYRVWVR